MSGIVPVPPCDPSESLLVISDVHLGSDLNDCAQSSMRRSTAIDRDLVGLLAHYRRQRPPADRWRMVVAGDFIDFIGMAIAPQQTERIDTELTQEECKHGLGSAVDHACLKLQRVARRHHDVFEELASFVADGHALSFVHGNHDIEFHWDLVKDDLRRLLLSCAQARQPELDAAAFLARIEFNPWFFYRAGVAYVEHGHQYDPFCSTTWVMSPLSPLDPRRLARGFSDVLLRFVVRPTRGMSEHGHENMGLTQYVTFGAKLGCLGMLRLGARFTRAVVELFRLRRAYFSEAAKSLRIEHERRVARFAEVTRFGKERLGALLALQAAPITDSIRGILGSVLLDRLALALAVILVVVVSLFAGPAVYVSLIALLAWPFLHHQLSRQRKIDVSDHLVERAAHISQLFPAAFLVMGHTHVPTAARAGDATYINVGSWAEQHEPTEIGEPYRAARTHVVIHMREDRPEAHFCTWDPEAGPCIRPLP